jgi:hypothetical protein
MASSRASGVTWRLLATVTAAALALGAAVVNLGSLVALVVPGIVCVFALLALVRYLTDPYDDSEMQRRIYRWTLAVFAVRLVVGLTISSVDTLARFLGPDAPVYHQDAIRVVQHWVDGLPLPVLPAGKEGFYYMLAGIYWLFGTHMVGGLVVNAAMAAALIPIVTDTTSQLFGRAPTRYVPALVTIAPSLLLFPSQLLREAAIIFLIAVAANSACRIADRVTPGALGVFVASIALLFTFRAWIALLLAQGLFVGIMLGRRQVLTGITAGLGAGILVALLVVSLGVGYSGYKSAVNADFVEANSVRLDLATSGSSSFASEVDISSPRSALSYLPRGLVNFLLGPLPWQISGLRHLPGLVDALVIWMLIPSIWRGLREAWSLIGRRMLISILPALLTTVLMALTIANFGTVVRERMQVVILVVPFIALGLAARLPRGQPQPALAQAH